MKTLSCSPQAISNRARFLLYFLFVSGLVFSIYSVSVIAQEGAGRKAIQDVNIWHTPHVDPFWAIVILIFPISMSMVLFGVTAEIFENEKRKCLPEPLLWFIYILLYILAVPFFIFTTEKHMHYYIPSWFRLIPLILAGIPAGMLYAKTTRDWLPAIFIIPGFAYLVLFFYLAGSNASSF